MAKVSKRTVSVDMTDVKAGGVVLPEGDYVAEVLSVESVKSDTSGKSYLKWELSITEGPLKGSKVWHNTSLQPQALFNLKGVLISCGVAVPEGKLNLDLDDLEGRIMGITIKHEEYEGKTRARIVETFPIDDSESSGDDEEGDESESLDDMGLDELLEFAADKGIKISARDKKSEAKVRAAIEAVMEEEPEEEEESEEESEEVDLDSMKLPELLELAEENEIAIPKKYQKNIEKVREIIEAELAEAEAEAEDEEEEDCEEEEEVDLDSLDKDELLEFAKENGIKLTLKQKKTETTIRKAIEAALTEEE